MPPSDAFDPVEFKRNVRTEWRSAAPGWHRWMDVVEAEEGGRRHSDTLIRLAELRRGAAVLDVGGGYGEPSLTAARAVGPGGRVVCTDISPEMLNVARERASDAGITNIEFVVRDAEGLGFDDASFDAVLSRATLLHRRQQPQTDAASRPPGLSAPRKRRNVPATSGRNPQMRSCTSAGWPASSVVRCGATSRMNSVNRSGDSVSKITDTAPVRTSSNPACRTSSARRSGSSSANARAARRWRRQRELLGDDRERRGELRVTDAYRPFQRADGRVRTENRAIWVTGVR